jgi:1-acyl-sn-glycerol-3-phosphate acyltransferase
MSFGMSLLRSVIFNVVMFTSGAIFSLFGLVLNRVAPERMLGVAVLWARLVIGALEVICGIRLRVIGAEHLPRAGAAVIAAQHQSAFDTLVWLTLLPRTAYVLKVELLKLPLMGKLLVPTGFIPVDRAGGARSLRQLVVDCRRAANADKQIVIFPEGTRVAPGERGELLPGVVAVAHSLNLPVIPVATDSGLYWGKQAFTKRPGVLTVRVFPPLPLSATRAEILQRLDACFYHLGVDKSVEEAAPTFVN